MLEEILEVNVLDEIPRAMIEEGEAYKLVPNFKGYYAGSNFGNIWSHWDQKLCPWITGFGYLKVNLWTPEENFEMNIHRLVMWIFVGPCPEGMEVNHIDGIKHNNYLSNLEYCTRSENIKHAFRTGLKISNKGEKHGMSFLTEEEVKEIRRLDKETNLNQIQLGEMFNVERTTIGKIVRRQIWKHI